MKENCEKWRKKEFEFYFLLKNFKGGDIHILNDVLIMHNT